MKRRILGAVLLMALALTVLSQTLSSSQNQRTSGDIPRDLQVSADRSHVESSGGERIFVYEGQAEARLGEYQLRADRIAVYEQSRRMAAAGHATFQRSEERMSGSSVEWSYGETQNRVTIAF